MMKQDGTKTHRVRAACLAAMVLLGLCPTHAEGSEPLTASGAIRARELRIAGELGGRIIAVHPQAGEAVKAGSVLVEFDDTPVQLLLAQAEAAVAAAQADLALLKAGTTEAELAAARAAVAIAEAQRDGALAAWQNARDALQNPLQIDAQIIEARTQVALAAEQVQKADSEARGIRRLYDMHDPIVTAAWPRAADEALAAAQADRHAAEVHLAQLEAIREEPLALIAAATAAEGQYKVAEAGVAVAEAKLKDLEAGPSAEEVAMAEAAVRQAEAQANVLRVQKRKMTLTSPIDGVILQENLRAGEVAAPAAAVLTIADLSQVTLEVYVPEHRVAQVQLGARVQVTVDSFPGRTFTGTVARIADQAEFTPRNVATHEERQNTYYAVEVHLPNPEQLLKPGMPAGATFVS